ncbi:hypothetical protein [Paenibacillus sp. sgz500992]|uniref:hypothetical protein n=1 Tax=Paenibacillus sp. sgz500992 TaxID=3242476 RepID=UPI0036D25624
MEDRDQILNNILASDKWIIEGVHHKWVMQSFEMLKKMYIWNYGHQQKERPDIFAALKPYQDKLLVLRDNSKLHKHIKL